MEIKNFKDLEENTMEIIGGKGLSLVKMTRAGFNVPKGFVVPVEFELSETNKKDILSSFDALNVSKVAVRSSATVEDGSKNSWAGQFSSYLNISRDNLIEHIELVQESINNVRVGVYSEKTNITELKMAVVVQEMVDAVSSGIAFSMNPVTKDESVIVIEAGFGLGELIVSGTVTPDNYEVNKNDFETKKSINIQKSALYESGIKDLTQTEASSQKLNDNQIKEIAQEIIKLEKYFGLPVDVEWAYKDQLYILQARPITKTLVSPIHKVIEKINENGKYENEGTDIYFSWFVEDILIKATSKEMQEKIFGFYVPFDKYVVVNGDEYLAVDSDIANEDTYREKYDEKGIVFFKKHFDYMLNLCDDTETYRKDLLKIRFSEKNNNELRDIFESFYNHYLNIFTSGTNEPSSMLEEELTNKVKEVVPETELDKVLAIIKTKSDVRELDYVDEPLNLLYLAKEIKSEYGNEFPDKISQYFDERIENHTLEYGYLQNLPEFYDDTRPTIDYYIDRIKYFIKGDIDSKINKILDSRKKVQQDYEKVIKEYNITGELLELCELVRVCIMMRTYKVSFTDKLYYAGRYLGLFDEVAKRLNIEVIDLQSMSCEEIISSLNGEKVPENLEDRRDGYYILWNKDGVEVGFGKEVGDLQKMMKNRFIIDEEAKASDSKVIKGNVANFGIVKGKVKIVITPDDMDKFNEGEILVTAMTRPELIPAMEKAIGFITNEGGMTCHAAIVSREFNVPCIVGTINATEVLKDGDTVELDAFNGIVKII